MPLPLLIYICILSVTSLFTFCLYVADKKKAQKGKWRIPESSLIGFSLLGGGLGGYLAMLTVRHKTKHWYFHVANWLGIAWQVGVLIYFIIKS
ncbi:MAG: DUF1294 domain-containing protein [Clostridia bacterium]|nr:DUF1294 domain-containing protein [Clostridia bacterium]